MRDMTIPAELCETSLFAQLDLAAVEALLEREGG